MDFHPLLSTPQALLDIFILFLGFFIGVASRSRWIVIFLQVSMLLVKMAKWYFETHPDAKRKKGIIKIDEQIDLIYHNHLKKHDPENYEDLIGYEIKSDKSV